MGICEIAYLPPKQTKINLVYHILGNITRGTSEKGLPRIEGVPIYEPVMD